MPEPFHSLAHLRDLTDMFSVDPLDAQIYSYLAITGESAYLADEGLVGGVQESVTITYAGDMTVWDFPDGFREVLRGEESFVYSPDTEDWHINDRWEWPVFGPDYEWRFVQPIAPACIDHDPEVIGVQAVAGVRSLHIKCVEDGGVAEVWIGEEGRVLKSVVEIWEDPKFGLILGWEVTELDVPPGEPLPPGW